ncbi:ACT domain-containing protein, partial [Myxococcota bacterium]
RGITVHHTKCARAIDMDPARRIQVSWDSKNSEARPVSLRVLTADRPGILATISQTFSENGVNISQANCKVTGADRAINTFEVLVKNSDQLRKVINQVKRLTGVYGVERL